MLRAFVFDDELEKVLVHISGISYVKRLSKHGTVQMTTKYWFLM
jgi:hypothetical protein